jgi:hypothetical protein
VDGDATEILGAYRSMNLDPAEVLALNRYALIAEAANPRLTGRERGSWRARGGCARAKCALCRDRFLAGSASSSHSARPADPGYAGEEEAGLLASSTGAFSGALRLARGRR